MSILDRMKSRADVGRDLINAWENLELVLIRAGEVATGQEFNWPGALRAAIAHGERGGYFVWEDIRPLLAMRNAYLTAKHPATSDMRQAIRELRHQERLVRSRLGALAPDPIPVPPRPKPL